MLGTGLGRSPAVTTRVSAMGMLARSASGARLLASASGSARSSVMGMQVAEDLDGLMVLVSEVYGRRFPRSR
jgi:hypothetical protein